MNTTTIPVSITEGAAQRLAILGMHRELEAMIEWTRNNVRNLHAIVVQPGISHLDVYLNLVVIKAHCTFDEETLAKDPVESDWAIWKGEMFHPRVCSKFIMSCTSQPPPTP